MGGTKSSTSKHKWTFPARFRKGVYSWRGTAKASKNLKAAVSEIKKLAKSDPELGAEGATRLLEKLVPSIGGIDSSSGAIGSAVNKAVEELAKIVALGEDTPKHALRVGRVYEALQEDGYGYLDEFETYDLHLACDLAIELADSPERKNDLNVFRDYCSRFTSREGILVRERLKV